MAVEYKKSPMEKMFQWSDTMRRVPIPGFKVAEYAKRLLKEEREWKDEMKMDYSKKMVIILEAAGFSDAAKYLRDSGL